MGVKLQDLITRKQVDFSQLEGKVIAIDAPNVIFSLFNFIRKGDNDSNYILDRTQRVISHLFGLLYRVNFYYVKKIFPIFCFDGRVSPLKRISTKDYLHDFNITQQWYSEAMQNGNLDKAKKIALGKEYLWPNIIKESKELLGALGAPIINSPASAEAQCAHLVKMGVADFSNSQDFDSLLFGCPHLIQNLSKSLRRKQQGRWTYTKITPLSIDLEDNLKRLRINQFQLVDIAILIKTDYFSGINGIGPKIAYNLIKKHGNLENVILNEKNTYDFKRLTKKEIQDIRKILLLPDVLHSFDDLTWDSPNPSRIYKLLLEDHTLNRARIVNNTHKLIGSYERCKKYYKFRKTSPIKKQLTFDSFVY